MARPAVIAVASGKGGTGKTTVAAHLALASAQSRKTLLVDLDVEAPDALGYFPTVERAGLPNQVLVAVPHLLKDRCTGCGLCAKSCRFGAIVAIGGVVTIDERICKGCGRCVAACPAEALAETEVFVGVVSRFEDKGLELLEGRMVIGDIRSTAVIEAAKRQAETLGRDVQIRDCPPGVSCPASHAIEGADYAVLVAEPTEFSLHDLGAAAALVKGRGIPVGVVVNKDGFGPADVAGFCVAHGLPIIGRIAFDRERAQSGAEAKLWTEDSLLMFEMRRILERALGEARERREA
jgi:MinD superfamily P-loop ATPase